MNGRPGHHAVVFEVGETGVGPLICFESTYPQIARAMVRSGADILIVVTNNASFQTSPAAAQHLQMSRMRAIEHGRAVVHAAISGISAFIAPDGSVLDRSALFEQDLLRAVLPTSTGQTPYARYGAFIEIAMGAGAAVVTAAAAAARGRRRRAA